MPNAVFVADVIAALGGTAPWSKAADWDSVGLQIGDPGAAVRTAAVCHEVTDDVVAAVETAKIDLLVTYHPLLFRPVTALTAGPTPAGRALRLAAAGGALVVAHTNFDVASGGVADALAEALRLTDVAGFGPVWGPESVKVVTYVPPGAVDRVSAAMTGVGAGEIGAYTGCSFRINGTGTFFPGAGADPYSGELGTLNEEAEVRIEMNAPMGRVDRVVAALTAAHPYDEPAYDVFERRGDAGYAGRIGSRPGSLADLAAGVEEALGGVLRVAGDPETSIGRVAVVPGSGGDFIAQAASAGADVLVTGDVSHHRAVRAGDLGMAVIDPGHAATERPGVARLYAAVAESVDGVIDLTGPAPGPWNERPSWRN